MSKKLCVFRVHFIHELSPPLSTRSASSTEYEVSVGGVATYLLCCPPNSRPPRYPESRWFRGRRESSAGRTSSRRCWSADRRSATKTATSQSTTSPDPEVRGRRRRRQRESSLRNSPDGSVGGAASSTSRTTSSSSWRSRLGTPAGRTRSRRRRLRTLRLGVPPGCPCGDRSQTAPRCRTASAWRSVRRAASTGPGAGWTATQRPQSPEAAGRSRPVA